VVSFKGSYPMDSLFILVHVGWSMVAEELRQQKVDVAVPMLTDRDDSSRPYWQQHTEAVKQTLADVLPERPVVLVGHSGAGRLLPAIHRAIAQPVAACVFVDASLPNPGMSALDELAINVPDLAQELRPFLVAGGSYPTWGAQELREILPDPVIREQFLAELHPRNLRFFEEKMPDVAIQPDTSCGYILLSEAYLGQLRQALRAGWPSRQFHAGHFHMLVDPAAVTTGMIELLAEIEQ
jgi:pimeloyl-ACP methyl ester carboxylesterase